MPKLNLRDLFWLVLVAAILCTWWVDRSRQAKEIERVNSALWGARGGIVRLIQELKQKDAAATAARQISN